jgi:hypothetical protein
MKTTDFINESFVEDAAAAHQDHEVQMARGDCYNAAKYAIELHKLLKNISEQEGLDGWVSEKITLANDYLRTVTEYLRYEQQSGSSSDMPNFDVRSATQTLDSVLGESATSNLQENAFTWYLKAHGRLLSPLTSDEPYKFNSKEEAVAFAKEKYKTNWQNIVPTTYDVPNSLADQPDKGWNEKNLKPVAEEEPEPKRKPAVVKTNKEIGTRVADIGPGGKEYNVKTNKAWDDEHKQEPGVAEAKADPVGSWVVYDGGKVKRFKSREGAKAYAAKNGGKVASSEHYADNIQKQGVAEGSTWYAGNGAIKEKIAKYEELALKANREGDDAKTKMYQQKIQTLKQKMSHMEESAGGMGAASVATSMGGGNGFANGGPGTIARPRMKKKK